MNFIKPNLKSLPEQVDINTNDIKNLKSVLKSSEFELLAGVSYEELFDKGYHQGGTNRPH